MKRILFFFLFIILSISTLGLDYKSYISSCNVSSGTIVEGTCSELYDNSYTNGDDYGFCASNSVPKYITIQFTQTLKKLTSAYIRNDGLQSGQRPSNVTLFDDDGKIIGKYTFIADGNGGCEETDTWGTFTLTPYSNSTETDEITIRVQQENTESCFGGTCASTGNYGAKINEINFTFLGYTTDNDYPLAQIEQLKNTYCLNESDNEFELNITDEESDTIYYSYDWDNKIYDYHIIEDFNDENFNLMTEGWHSSNLSCNYSTIYQQLDMGRSCNNVNITKKISNDEFKDNINIEFYAWVFWNTTAYYEIFNDIKQKAIGIKLQKFWDNTYGSLYTNLSYWDGSNYVYFGKTYYQEILAVDFILNETDVTFCVNGLDEPSYYGCNQRVKEELHGNAGRNLSVFLIKPQFNFAYYSLQEPIVMIDDIRYKKNDIVWTIFNNQDINREFDNEGSYDLDIYVTDTMHAPLYKKYSFPIIISGLCKYEIAYNKSSEGIEAFTDKTRAYINEFEYGEDIFNNAFYFFMFIAFVLILITFKDLPVTFVITGGIFLIVSYFLSGDMMQLITSSLLIAIGIIILIMGVV